MEDCQKTRKCAKEKVGFTDLCFLDDPNRQILEEPFSVWQRFLKCGTTSHTSNYNLGIASVPITKSKIRIDKTKRTVFDNSPEGIVRACSEDLQDFYRVTNMFIIDDSYRNIFRNIESMILKKLIPLSVLQPVPTLNKCRFTHK